MTRGEIEALARYHERVGADPLPPPPGRPARPTSAASPADGDPLAELRELFRSIGAPASALASAAPIDPLAGFTAEERALCAPLPPPPTPPWRLAGRLNRARAVAVIERMRTATRRR